jgi:hypothetical protein
MGGLAHRAHSLEHGLQEGRSRRQPGRAQLACPLFELLGTDRGRHGDAAADQQRHQERRLEAGVVIDRQDAGRPVGRREPEPLSHLARHLEQVLVGDRHALGCAGRARSAEDGCHRIGLERHRRLRMPDRSCFGEHNIPEGSARLRDGVQPEVAPGILRPDRQPGPSRHDQRVEADLLDLCLQIAGRQVGIERQHGGSAADGNTDQRRLGTTRQRHAHARPRSDTGGTQLRGDAAHQIAERAERQRGKAGTNDCRRAGIARSMALQRLCNRHRHVYGRRTSCIHHAIIC